MTDEELQAKRQNDAEKDAEEIGLLLLVLLNRRRKRSDAAFSGPEVRFDAAAGRFYYRGRSVSINQIRAYLLRIEDRFSRQLLKAIDELEAGRITLDDFKEQSERKITSAHILAAGLALGGIRPAVSNPTVLKRITEELEYLENFIRDIGKRRAGSFRRIKARMKQYLKAASNTYSVVEQTARETFGYQTEAMRIRRASESCKGCIRYANRWMPIELMPPIGTLNCRHHCRCYLVYR